MKLSTYAKKLGVGYKTAWNHFQKGLIPGAYQLPTGTIIVPDPPEKQGLKDLKVAVYARVSSSQNKKNLTTQAERISKYCQAKGYRVTKVVKEIGSGLNDERKKFLDLIQDSGIDIIVVEHKDRATRFGLNYIQVLLSTQNKKIEVINEVDENQQDLLEDLISIVTSFLARYYGRRRAKRKTETIIQELKNDS